MKESSLLVWWASSFGLFIVLQVLMKRSMVLRTPITGFGGAFSIPCSLLGLGCERTKILNILCEEGQAGLGHSGAGRDDE